ncbi:MAG: universal stress protein [Actinomycetota bacterium]|nr:universal stress protein [Actinomycetota bacterium]
MFDTYVAVFSVGGLWLAIGVLLGVAMGHPGHSGLSWLVLGTLLGPLAVVLALDSRRHDGALNPVLLTQAMIDHRAGCVDVLAGYDGSPESLAAIGAAADLLDPRLGRLTVTTVVPFDGGAEEEPRATAALRGLVGRAGRAGGLVPECTVLHGRPAEALRDWATHERYEMIAVGTRGAGFSKRILGSATSELARGSKVPVLLVGSR